MDTNPTLLNHHVVAERETALRHVEHTARASRATAEGDAPARGDVAGRRRVAGMLDVVTPLLFLVLVTGMLALVAMGASVR